MDLFYVNFIDIRNNNCSFNVGWGIHLYKSAFNKIIGNLADNCTRGYLYEGGGGYSCDTAGLLMNCECHDNFIAFNSFRFGGDGIFMSGFPRNGLI